MTESIEVYSGGVDGKSRESDSEEHVPRGHVLDGAILDQCLLSVEGPISSGHWVVQSLDLHHSAKGFKKRRGLILKRHIAVHSNINRIASPLSDQTMSCCTSSCCGYSTCNMKDYESNLNSMQGRDHIANQSITKSVNLHETRAIIGLWFHMYIGFFVQEQRHVYLVWKYSWANISHDQDFVYMTCTLNSKTSWVCILLNSYSCQTCWMASEMNWSTGLFRQGPGIEQMENKGNCFNPVSSRVSSFEFLIRFT